MPSLMPSARGIEWKGRAGSIGHTKFQNNYDNLDWSNSKSDRVVIVPKLCGTCKAYDSCKGALSRGSMECKNNIKSQEDK